MIRAIAITFDSEPQYIRVELISGGRTARTDGPSHTDSVGQGDAQAAPGEDGAAQLRDIGQSLTVVDDPATRSNSRRSGTQGEYSFISWMFSDSQNNFSGAPPTRDYVGDDDRHGRPLRRTGSGSADDLGPADPAAVALALCATSLAEAGAQGGTCVFAPADMVRSGAAPAPGGSIAFSGRVVTASGPEGEFAARVYDLAPVETAGAPQLVLAYDPDGFEPSSLCANGCDVYGLRPAGSGNGSSGLTQAAGQAAVDFGMREAAARVTGGRGGAASPVAEPTGVSRGGVSLGGDTRGSGSTAGRALGALGRAATSRSAETVAENTSARFLDMELVEAGLSRTRFSTGFKIEVPDTDEQAYQEIHGRAETR